MSKEIWEKPKCSSNVGGEALIEGVMMRGNNIISSAYRKADGEIIVEKEEYIPVTKRKKILNIPILRGAIGFFESMVIGMKALMKSAEYVEIEEEEPGKIDKFFEKLFGDKLMTVMLYFSVVVAMIFGIGLFMILPNVIADFFNFNKSSSLGSIIGNLIEGLIRVLIFFGYIVLVSKMDDIRRVFEYHGAEHKTIYCYEQQEELTVENARKYTTLHPRCGTALLFVVMIVSIIVFSFTGWHSKLVNIGIRLLLLPVVAGLSYEVMKFASKSNSKLLQIVYYPGLFLQKFTTKEPDDKQLEVAIAALKGALEK